MTKKSSRAIHRPFLTILGISIVLAVMVTVWKSTRPKPIEIMAIDPVPLEYGSTMISGVVQKDSNSAEGGVFLLALADGRAVILDVQGIDHLVGLNVSVKGNLTLTQTDKPYLIMIVESIAVSQE